MQSISIDTFCIWAWRRPTPTNTCKMPWRIKFAATSTTRMHGVHCGPHLHLCYWALAIIWFGSNSRAEKQCHLGADGCKPSDGCRCPALTGLLLSLGGCARRLSCTSTAPDAATWQMHKPARPTKQHRRNHHACQCQSATGPAHCEPGANRNTACNACDADGAAAPPPWPQSTWLPLAPRDGRAGCREGAASACVATHPCLQCDSRTAGGGAQQSRAPRPSCRCWSGYLGPSVYGQR